jgi:dihydroneopterin aldolase
MQNSNHSRIDIEGMEFHAYHGVYDEEKVKGGKYLVDLSFEYDSSKAQATDHIDDTIDYSVIYKLIESEMKKSSDLIEHLARRIMNRIRHRFTNIYSVQLTVKKLNPPIEGIIKAVSITLFED